MGILCTAQDADLVWINATRGEGLDRRFDRHGHKPSMTATVEPPHRQRGSELCLPVHSRHEVDLVEVAEIGEGICCLVVAGVYPSA